MRYQFSIVLIISLLVSGWFYYKNAPPCIVPQAYTIGSIDPRFNISTSTAKEIVGEAAAVWGKAAQRDLFVYDDKATFNINFIYDDRQANSDKAESQKELLTAKEEQSKKIAEEYKSLVEQYDTLKAEYDKDVTSYQTRLNTFNNTVAKFNESGGAPPEDYARLQKTETSLKREEKKLESTADTLSSIAKDINTLSEQGNAVISEYNKNVENFNEKFSGGEEFTQGDYTGTAVHVFHFKDKNELRNVLIHEFGHAIGLSHVEGSESIMYYLMDKQPNTSDLSREDLAALGLACKENDSTIMRFHRFLSSIFIKLHLI